MACPHRLLDGSWWDGKIGSSPVGEHTVAQRTSVNRGADTDEFKKQSINQDEHGEMMINDVVPSIQSEIITFEQSRHDVICIQHDGAPSHSITENKDGMWHEEMESLGLPEQIRMVTQPPNSTDVNVNNLGFFNSLHAMCWSWCPKNSLELIDMATSCFEDCPADKINRIWLTCQSCLNEIIKCNGHNTHKIPHMNKEKLERTDKLPSALDVCAEGVALPQGQCC